MTLPRNRKVALAVLVLVLLAVAIGAALTLKSVDAEPIGGLLHTKYQMQKYVLDSGRVVQLSASIPIPYPNRAIDDGMLETLRKMGWQQCTGPNSDWEAHLESPGPVLVHQRTTYLRRGLELLVVHARYESKGAEKELRALKQPNSDLQTITVLVSNEGPLIYLKTSMLGVSCS
jgi:hypothetical protein